ncbi:MAG: hypothetical protein IKK61_06165, partial [Clostridia bacterium]|nr:hypothetical protein [Oscillospiraceae bacterium]MBR6574561.1 hypothetical protein [Clostridia bacterium]
MRNHAKRWLALLLAMTMLLAMTACSNNDEPQTNDQPQQEQQTPQQSVTPQQPTEEDYNGKLISEGMMDIQYAQQFAIEKFKGGYRLVTDNLSGNKILVVPENMKVPTELDSDVQVLQLPVTNA